MSIRIRHEGKEMRAETNLFQKTVDFWAFQLNDEIYLRNHPHI